MSSALLPASTDARLVPLIASRRRQKAPERVIDPPSQPHRDRPSRVERGRGGLGNAYLLTGPFGGRCLTSAAVPRFHLPLIEPDVQISRIRLPDKVPHLRPREVARSSLEPDQPEAAQVGFRVA